MPSSRFYKIWLWEEGVSTAWVEVPSYTGLVFGETWGMPSRATFTAYSKTDTVRARILPGTIVRITKKYYSDGVEVTDPDDVTPEDTKIRDFFILEPGRDDKTLFNGDASIFNVECGGPEEEVAMASIVVTSSGVNISGGPYAGTINVYTNQTMRGSLQDLITHYLNDPVDGYNIRAGGAADAFIVRGTIDTPGITVAVKAKGEQLWNHLIDIASIGDTTTDFPLMVYVDFQSVGAGASRLFKPRINILAANNSTFAFPYAHSGFVTTNPFTGPTESRILDEKTELGVVNVDEGKDRVINRVTTRYAGAGTQAPQGETSTVNTVASQTEFGVREVRTLDPWIQQDADPGTGTTAGASVTADARRDTVLATYNGIDPFTSAAVGVVTAVAVCKTGELYHPTSFINAVIGDMVGIRMSDASVGARQRLLGYVYAQESESLTYTLGLPKVDLETVTKENTRRLMQRVANLSVTANSPAASDTTPSGGSGTSGTNVPSSSVLLYEISVAGNLYSANEHTVDSDTTVAGGADPDIDDNDGFFVTAQIDYDGTAAGEASYSDWWVSVALLKGGATTVEFHVFNGPIARLVEATGVDTAGEDDHYRWLNRWFVPSAYLKSLGWTSVGGIQMVIENTGSTDQTLSSYLAFCDRVPTHTHSTPSHTHTVNLPAHKHNA